MSFTSEYNYKNLKHEFSESDLKQLLLHDGYTYRDLQKKYTYNERLWSRLAKEYGIPKQQQHIQRNSIKACTKSLPINEIMDLYINQHKSLREIARIFNVQKAAIKRRLIDNGVEIRPFNDETYYENRQGHQRAEPYKEKSTGYIRIGEQRQHRVMAEKKIGRPLADDEVVHHIDGNKDNNSLDNLFVFQNNRIHQLFHGQSWTDDPSEFTDYYNTVLSETLLSRDWLYEQYISNNQSVSAISKKLKIGRSPVTKMLKHFNIYNLRHKNINQYDQVQKCD